MKVLYIMSSYNLYGGTPKKTLDLMKHFKGQSVLYVYHNSFSDLKPQFEATGAKIYEGFYNRNLFSHLKKLLTVIDNEKIDIVQTQFSMGETLGFLIKIFRPKVKLVVAFVGPFKPSRSRKVFISFFYRKVDSFIYITKYVKNEKFKQFPILAKKKGVIIYNGTEKLKVSEGKPFLMEDVSILDVAALIDWKNIQILISSMELIVSKYKRNEVHLYVAGEGEYRKKLEAMIKSKFLDNNVHLIGNQKNIGNLLHTCTVFTHPSYAEGFGIAVAEAMHSEKPIIVSKAGGLPELIENETSGLVISPYNAEEWANAILKLIDNPTLAKGYARQAKVRADEMFSVKKYTNSYEEFYDGLMKTSTK